jgi:hypothetical protein
MTRSDASPLSCSAVCSLPAVRRANSLFVAVAVLFAVIQPRTDVLNALASGGGLSALDILTGDSTHAQWPAWLLFVALTLLVISLTAMLPLPRMLFAAVLGSSLAMYISGLCT